MANGTLMIFAEAHQTWQAFYTMAQQHENTTIIANFSKRWRKKLPYTRTIHSFPTIARDILHAHHYSLLSAELALQTLYRLVEPLPLRYLSHHASDMVALMKLVSEMFHANIEVEAVRPQLSSDREHDLLLIFESILAWQHQHRLVFPSASEYVASRLNSSPQTYLLYGFAYFDAAQRALLHNICSADSKIFITAQPNHLVSAESWHSIEALAWPVQYPQPVASSKPKSHLGAQAAQYYGNSMQGEDVDVLWNDDLAHGLKLRRYAHPRQEVHALLQYVQQQLNQHGANYAHDVVIVASDLQYLPLLRDLAAEYDLPIYSHQKRCLADTPLGSLLKLLLSIQWTPQGAALDALYAELHQHIWCTTAWQRPADAWLQQPEQLQPAQVYGQQLHSWLQQLGLEDRASQSPLGRWCLKYLKQLDRQLPNWHTMTAQWFDILLQEWLDTASFPIWLHRHGIQVASPLAILGHQYREVLVLGLNQGVFPAQPQANPFLDDVARLHWNRSGADLLSQSRYRQVAQTLFYQLLGSASHSLYLSYAQSDVLQKPLAISSFIRPFLSHTPAQSLAISHAQPRLAQALGGQLPSSDPAQQQAQHELRRLRGELNPYAGQLNPAHVPQDVLWSPSQLTVFGQCAFRWWGQYVLKLDAPSSTTAQRLGSNYHALLETWLTPYLKTQLDVAQLQQALQQDLPQLLHRYQDPQGSAALWLRQIPEIQRIFQRLLKAANFITPHQQPYYLELKLHHQLQRPLGKLRYQGIIDRIDRRLDAPNHSYVLIDYKTNSYISKVRFPLNQGNLTLDIQMGLYLEGLQAHWNTTATGDYLSIRKAEILKHKLDTDAILEFIDSVLSRLQAGEMAILPDQAQESCSYCHLRSLCRMPTTRSPLQLLRTQVQP